MKKRKVYIDTDVGLGTPFAEIDDGAALMVLFKSDTIDIVGIGSVFGNVPVDDAHANLARLLHFLDREDIPIGKGAEIPLAGDLSWFKEWKQEYGQTPPFEEPKPEMKSSDLLSKIIQGSSEKISIISLGPMTNIALALEQNLGLREGIHEIIAMGGSYSGKTTLPEFNIHCDPTAASFVLNAGVKMTMIGLDITGSVSFPRSEFSSLGSTNRAVYLLKEQVDGWINRVEKKGWHKDGCALHDAVAAAYVLTPEFFTIQDAAVEVSVEEGGNWGRTTVELLGKSDAHQVATKVATRKVHNLIWSAIESFQEG